MSKCRVDFKANKCEFCEDCVHGQLCMWRAFPQDPTEHCQFFKDKSLFVELPCKVGDVVYTTNCSKVVPRVVKEICYNNKGITYTSVLANNKESKYWFSSTTIGKTVFLTKEDAEKKLKEIEV